MATPGEQYRQWLLSNDGPKTFEPLQSFVNGSDRSVEQVSTPSSANISVITFSNYHLPDIRTIAEGSLEMELIANIHHQVFVVENITPGVLNLLGGYCKVDPQFFIDYLDRTVELDPATAYRDTKPWYAFRDIEYHLPLLHSAKEKISHISLRFIRPREYLRPSTNGEPLSIRPFITSDQRKTRFNRIAGGYNPVQPEVGEKLIPAAMIRQHTAAWFDSTDPDGRWTKGIILTDPRFNPLQDIGVAQNPKLRSFSSSPIPFHPFTVQESQSDLVTLVECIRNNALLKDKKIPSQFTILQDLFRLLASEWISVNKYLERDLNNIEIRFEDPKRVLTLKALESFQERLFIMRRRVRLYMDLIDEKLQICGPLKPSSWIAELEVLSSIQKDLGQAKSLMQQNSSRITDSVALITSLMAVLEGKQSMAQNRRVGFLTVLATLILPLNTLIAVLSMQTDYAPGNPKFWNFFNLSWIILGLATFGLLLLYITPWLLARRPRSFT